MGWLSKKAKAAARMILFVFMAQRYDDYLIPKKNEAPMSQTLTLFVFAV
jgi:hypothetical protein